MTYIGVVSIYAYDNNGVRYYGYHLNGTSSSQ